MIRALLLFEDRHWRSLRPLTELACVPALAFGGSSLARRWRAAAALPLLAIEAREAPLAAWRERPAPEVERLAGPGEVAGGFEQRGTVHRLAALESPDAIAIGEGAHIEAQAVLDARGGPIRIGAGARVAAHTLVSGPCAVGTGAELLGGAIGGSTIGPRCFIAGEVEASLWQGFANKRHHGFVGHSLIGEWVNLGALTTTSDLKNNYGSVRVWVDGREVESGQIKVGAFIGAHTKTGIGSLLPTGASIGSGSNLFGGGRFAPRSVPPFAWWDGERMVEHRLEPFLATARISMGRRERPMSPADERLLRSWFEASAAERGAGEVAAGAPAARGAS